MAIKDLQSGQGKVNIVGKISEMGDIREFQKFGSAGKVANAKLADESGEIVLSLWNEQTEQVKVGDNVKITNGYVKEWQGEKQLSTGKFGTMEVIEGGASTSKKTTTPTPSAPKSASKKPVETEVSAEEFDEIEFEEEFLE